MARSKKKTEHRAFVGFVTSVSELRADGKKHVYSDGRNDTGFLSFDHKGEINVWLDQLEANFPLSKEEVQELRWRHKFAVRKRADQEHSGQILVIKTRAWFGMYGLKMRRKLEIATYLTTPQGEKRCARTVFANGKKVIDW